MPLRLVTAATILILITSAIASAQTTQPAAGEDLEPRTVGAPGTLLVGGAFHFDQVYSSERLLPFNYTLMGDVTRFLTPRIAVRGAVSGSGSRGGDEDDAEDRPVGVGVPALHARAALLYYLTPTSMWSPYGGAEYSVQMTQRDGRSLGTAFGTLGLEGAISSRVHLFFEGGYGIGSGGNENTTRLVSYVGLRVRLTR
jgi:hypothetical protein